MSSSIYNKKVTNISTFYCRKCEYITNHKNKYDRHVKTLKHKISTKGIKCCDIIYYNKHKWINHKKSKKHVSRVKSHILTNPLEESSYNSCDSFDDCHSE